MENFFNYYNQQPHSSSSPPPPQSHHILYKERRRTSTAGPFIKPAGSGGGSTKLSTDPQSVAARERRHRISDRFRILKSLVPGGSKMDTVSMLEEAIHYVKFLKAQIWLHQTTTMLHDQEQSSPFPSSLPHPLHDPMMDSIMPQLPNLANGIFHGDHEMASHDGFNF